MPTKKIESFAFWEIPGRITLAEFYKVIGFYISAHTLTKSRALTRILSWKISDNFWNNHSLRQLWERLLSFCFCRCLFLSRWNSTSLFSRKSSRPKTFEILRFLKVFPKSLKNMFVEVSSSKVSDLRKSSLFPQSFEKTYRHNSCRFQRFLLLRFY